MGEVARVDEDPAGFRLDGLFVPRKDYDLQLGRSLVPPRSQLRWPERATR